MSATAADIYADLAAKAQGAPSPTTSDLYTDLQARAAGNWSPPQALSVAMNTASPEFQSQELAGEEGVADWVRGAAERTLLSPITSAARFAARVTGHDPNVWGGAVQSALSETPSADAQQFQARVVDPLTQPITQPIAHAVTAADQAIGTHFGPGVQHAVEQTAGGALDVAGMLPMLGVAGRVGGLLGAAGEEGASIGAGAAEAAGTSEAGSTAAGAAGNVDPAVTAAGVARQASADETGRLAQETRASPAPVPVTDPSVAARARVLNDVGFTNARESALTQDGPRAMAEYQISRDPTSPQGLAARAVFDNERQTLSDFASNVAQSTGGTVGTDALTLENRGQTILKPFEDLTDYFDQQRHALYDAADAKAAGQPVTLSGFSQELADPSNLTDPSHVTLQPAVTAFANKAGMSVDEDSGQISGTAAQAELMRKYLNNAWTPQNGSFVGTLKGALDNDVLSSAGEDIYGPARQLVTQQKNTLDNPAGIGKLLDASGPAGINRKVPYEKVADTVMSMPNAQLQHVVTTLQQMPDELQPQAHAALGEIRSQFANRLAEAGDKTQSGWNNTGVNRFMANYSAKLPVVFGENSPALADMNTLRAAGNILRVDRGYPGAAVQGRILTSKLLPMAARGGGALLGEGVGSVLGAPGLGTAVGGGVGGYAGEKIAARSLAKAQQVRQRSLADVLGPRP